MHPMKHAGGDPHIEKGFMGITEEPYMVKLKDRGRFA